MLCPRRVGNESNSDCMDTVRRKGSKIFKKLFISKTSRLLVGKLTWMRVCVHKDAAFEVFVPFL